MFHVNWCHVRVVNWYPKRQPHKGTSGQMAVGQHQWYHFGVGEFTTHCRTYFSGWIESDVHWGLTGVFDP